MLRYLTKEEFLCMLENHEHYIKQDSYGWEVSNPDMSYLNLNGVIIRGVDLTDCDANDTQFKCSNCHRTIFIGGNCERCDFTDAVMTKALLDFGWFRKAVFKSADLKGVKARKANFEKADFTNADLRWSECNNTTFAGARLKGADLSMSMLDNADFSGADLTGACFNHASLKGAIFEGAIIKDAKFIEADLEGSRFKYAKIGGTIF